MIGVSSGTIPRGFVHKKPGPVCHARWLTTATRILMLYTRTVAPSSVFTLLVKFIQTIYGPFWFKIKKEQSFVKAPQLLHEMLVEVKAIDDDEEQVSKILKEALQRNAFCCLPENFLASLLFSEDQHHREMAVNKIKAIRNLPEKDPVPGHIPNLNFSASDWSELIDFSEVDFEPPCSRTLSLESLENMVAEVGPLPNIPIHTQSVERAVKLTSEAAKTSYSWEKRHRYIIAKNLARKQRKKAASKKDFI
jgi:hypothetical protein